jgi:hypothetical protein
MTNLDVIRKLRNSTFEDEDGGNYKLEFEPAMTDREINDLQKSFPAGRIPAAITEMLRETTGWSGYGPDPVSFNAIGEFGYTALIEHSITLGNDGFGNSWLMEIKINGDPGKIFFACHDPAVLVIFCDTINEFLNHLVEFYENPGENYLNEVHDNTTIEVWESNPNICNLVTFRKNNPALQNFLNEFEGDNWVVADLRDKGNRSGFAWGKFGPSQLTRRHPHEMIWVIKAKEKGFFSRLFGK